MGISKLKQKEKDETIYRATGGVNLDVRLEGKKC